MGPTSRVARATASVAFTRAASSAPRVVASSASVAASRDCTETNVSVTSVIFECASASFSFAANSAVSNKTRRRQSNCPYVNKNMNAPSSAFFSAASTSAFNPAINPSNVPFVSRSRACSAVAEARARRSRSVSALASSCAASESAATPASRSISS